MSQQSVEKKSVPWLLMGLGLLIPFLIIGILFLAAKSDAQNKKQYGQQRLEMEKRIAEKEAANSDEITVVFNKYLFVAGVHSGCLYSVLRYNLPL